MGGVNGAAEMVETDEFVRHLGALAQAGVATREPATEVRYAIMGVLCLPAQLRSRTKTIEWTAIGAVALTAIVSIAAAALVRG